MPTKRSPDAHFKRIVDGNRAPAKEQLAALRSIQRPSRSFLERIARRGDPVGVSKLAEEMLHSAPAKPESLSSPGPSPGPVLGSDLFYRSFLSADEISIIYRAALDGAKAIFFDLLGGPADPRLPWCDTADVLRCGVCDLRNGKLNPADLGLGPDVLSRIESNWDALDRWHTERWKAVMAGLEE